MSVPATQFATPDRFHPADGTGTLIRPVVFDDHLGWLHLPAGPSRREAGVVLVAPPGRDGRCVYRPLRDLAEQLAQAGFPTLRFDLKDVGDSLDADVDSDIWPVWLDGVAAAAALLKTTTGVHHLVLGGVRLGASLAASAAVESDGLILLAPVVSGRQWLRELKLAGAMSGTGTPEGGLGLEADGLYLSPATVANLGTLDLNRLEIAPTRALVAGQNTSAAAVGDRLAELSCDVSSSDFPGYEALLDDTHSNRAPRELFARIAAWLDDAFPRLAPQEVTALHLAAEPVAVHPPGAIEHPVHFGPGLNGVLCLPDGAASDGRAVIFCNTSGEPRAGIGRFAVLAARELARHGVASLRFDFAGVGDSEGEGPTHIYSVPRTDDFTAAVTLLAAEGFPEVSVMAVCSGAFHALRALIADPRIGGAFTVSAKLVWQAGEGLAPDMKDEGKATGAYVQGLKDPAIWRRLLTGRIDVRAVLKTLAQRMAARLNARLNDKDGRALREGLAQVAERGGRAHLLMGLDDASLDELETFFGGKAAKLTRMIGMSYRVDPGLDHGLSRRDSREIALKELLAFVGAD